VDSGLFFMDLHVNDVEQMPAKSPVGLTNRKLPLQ
jgi:hypothetical protein